ncbi:hypothetical protein HD806DRAFT_527818 [Xylariaceae sp. AK1471]|nr:hypothetical protein HD806DRAFT_527818 [Xylariaceae sp. AK1471]
MSGYGRGVTIADGHGPVAPKLLLEKLKNERNTAIRKRDREEKDTEPDQDFIDEKNKKIEVLDLKIHNAEIELALTDVTGEGSEERKRHLEDELKDGKRKLKEFMDGPKGGKKQLEGTPQGKFDADGHAVKA